MKKTATIILNRNLPAVTDALYQSIVRNNADLTDVFVVEAGSDSDNLSQYCTWWADWPEARQHGLRVTRGFNYGLYRLWVEGRFADYEQFFLLTNDTEFEDRPVLEPLLAELEKHPRVGILSPCSRRWGERMLLEKQPTRYFWYVLHTAYLLRRQYIEAIMEREDPTFMNFLYDGSNFRGYGTEVELIAKGYVNDWATAITTRVWAEENEVHLKNKADLIKTDSFDENIKHYVEEGKCWMRRKYGFNSRWSLQMYAKFLYERFFEYYPEYRKYQI